MIYIFAVFQALFAYTLARAEDARRPVNIAWDSEPRTLDPRYAQDANSQYLENLIHCSLVEFGSDGQSLKGVAKEWTWSTPTKLIVTLKDGAKFSDGSDVTSADVVATYQFFLNPNVKVPSPRKSAFIKLKSIIEQGPKQVVFELIEPDAAFIINLVVGILPKSYAVKEMLTDKDLPPSCGPFVLFATSSEQMILRSNVKYTLGVPPKIAELVIKIVKDENTRYAKLVAGELDIVQNMINRDKLANLQKNNPNLRVAKRPGLTTTYLGFNIKDPILSNANVRRAIGYAVDRQKIVTHVLNGMAQLADTLLIPSDPYYVAGLDTPKYDPEKAKQLLDAAGFVVREPGKTRFKLSYKTTTDLTRVAVAKAIAAELKRVGIEVVVETLEWGRFKADVDQGKVQIWSLSWVGFKDPDIYRFAFASESFPPNGGNRGWFSQKELDRLLLDGKKELDQTKRKDLYAQAQRIVAAEQPYFFLWHEEIFAVINQRISGFELYADGRLSSLSSIDTAR